MMPLAYCIGQARRVMSSALVMIILILPVLVFAICSSTLFAYHPWASHYPSTYLKTLCYFFPYHLKSLLWHIWLTESTHYICTSPTLLLFCPPPSCFLSMILILCLRDFPWTRTDIDDFLPPPGLRSDITFHWGLSWQAYIQIPTWSMKL